MRACPYQSPYIPLDLMLESFGENEKKATAASVLIFGIGGVGLSIAQAAAMKSGYPIVGVDVTDKKLNMGKSYGLTHALSASTDDLDGRIRWIDSV